MRISQSAYQLVVPPRALHLATGDEPPRGQAGHVGHVGHAHFWERAFSRRQIIKTTAAGTAVILGSGLLAPGLASAKTAFSPPKPIPETIFPGAPFHILSPDSEEPSAITDFNGLIGATEIQGTGTDGLLFDVDMRFMQGAYVGADGAVHHDTFGFV